MSNSTNSNTVVNNSNNIIPRDGTRVVLREITATLQNSPPMHHGVRKVANNSQPGKTEHEVKVQFTREFVDAGAPDSRPESLSSASSFQSLTSTLSTRSSIQSTPLTPQRAADTSYANADIPGLDDLIAACGNIELNDKTDVEENGTFQSIADSTLSVPARDGSFLITNNLQNLSQEDAFTSAINDDSSHLNGTHDLSSDYKEALESSVNSSDAKKSRSDDKLGNSNSETVKNNIIPVQTDDNPITNHVNNSLDIPQSSVDNSLLNETRDLSLKCESADELNQNTTPNLALAFEKLENNSFEVENCSARSNASENSQPLNETIEKVAANCNSTFNNLNSSKSDASDLTHDLSNDNKNLSIDCNSHNTTDTVSNHSLNELSAIEADGNLSSLNDPLNLPPESDSNISTSNKHVLEITNDGITESRNGDVEAKSIEAYSVTQETPVEAESDKAFVAEKSIRDSSILSEQCVPDSSTDHITDAVPGYENQTEIASSSNIVPQISTNIDAQFLTENIVQEEGQRISDIHNVSTTGYVSEDTLEVEKSFDTSEKSSIELEKSSNEPEKSLNEPQNGLNESKRSLSESEKSLNQPEKSLNESEKKPIQSHEIPEVPRVVETATPHELPNEDSVNEPSKTVIKIESVETVLPETVSEIIVPCVPSQDLSNHFHELEESSKKIINVTPFPGSISESFQNLTLTLEQTSQNGTSSTTDDSNETVTIKEESFHSVDSQEGATETYNAFQPVKQSTSLNSDCNFIKLELAAQDIAEEIRNKSFEIAEDSDQFFSADPDLFLDTASLDFFLTRNNSKNTLRDLRAESLYVKFDPLVSNVSMLPQGPPQVVDGDDNAKNSIPQPTLDTPKRNPALAAIDRLLFYSPVAGTPNKVEEPPKIEEKIVQDKIPEAVPVVDETMAKELELVRSTVVQLDSQLDKQRKDHEEEMNKQRLKYKELQIELSREVQKKNEMTMVMDEYEKSLSRHMADRERERASFEQERAKLQEELQAANHHLGNTEAAFNDVHSKYERLKSVVSAYKSNEDVLKESVQENVETIKTLEARYDQLKGHAMAQLEKANMELEAIRKQHETETVRLQAMIRKAELKSNSLAEMVEQKSKENKELAEILDEVIARVGRQPE